MSRIDDARGISPHLIFSRTASRDACASGRSQPCYDFSEGWATIEPCPPWHSGVADVDTAHQLRCAPAVQKRRVLRARGRSAGWAMQHSFSDRCLSVVRSAARGRRAFRESDPSPPAQAPESPYFPRFEAEVGRRPNCPRQPQQPHPRGSRVCPNGIKFKINVIKFDKFTSFRAATQRYSALCAPVRMEQIRDARDFIQSRISNRSGNDNLPDRHIIVGDCESTATRAIADNRRPFATNVVTTAKCAELSPVPLLAVSFRSLGVAQVYMVELCVQEFVRAIPPSRQHVNRLPPLLRIPWHGTCRVVSQWALMRQVFPGYFVSPADPGSHADKPLLNGSAACSRVVLRSMQRGVRRLEAAQAGPYRE